MMMKTAKLGVKPRATFEERSIYSNAVYDTTTGKTAQEHMNDETIHIREDELSPVAFSGQYGDLAGKPDISQQIQDEITQIDLSTQVEQELQQLITNLGLSTVATGYNPDGSTIYLRIISWA